MAGQEDFVFPPWDEADAPSKWRERAEGAMRRSKTGFLTADLSQRKLPEGETIVRLLTARFGERYQHFFFDPTTTDGSITSTNCSAPPDFKGPKDDICPICAYARHKGAKEEGGADTSHLYYLILIVGKYQMVITKDVNNPNDPGTQSSIIVWENIPLAFECSGGVFNGIYKWQKDTDYPPGAEADITRYAFKIIKESTGAGAKNVRYDAAPIPELLPRPDISIEAVKEKYEFIRKICQPTKAQHAAEKLGLQMEQSTATPVPAQAAHKPVGADLELESPAKPGQPVAQPPAQAPPPSAKDLNWGEAF